MAEHLAHSPSHALAQHLQGPYTGPETRPEVPENTSASQLVTWSMCPRKYFFRYVAGVLPEYRSVALVLGSAVHGAIGWFFTERLEGRQPTASQATDVLDADVAAEVSESPRIHWGKHTEESLLAQGQELLKAYLAEYGNQPVVAVEHPFLVNIEDELTGEHLPRRFKGYFDLVLEDGTVVEVKTASRRWSEGDLARHLQVGAYLAARAALGQRPVKLSVHVLVKTKTPALQELSLERAASENRWWFDAAMQIEHAILAGHFPPTPGPLCHECEYGRSCERWTDFDEQVAPTPEFRRLPMVPAQAA